MLRTSHPTGYPSCRRPRRVGRLHLAAYTRLALGRLPHRAKLLLSGRLRYNTKISEQVSVQTLSLVRFERLGSSVDRFVTR